MSEPCIVGANFPQPWLTHELSPNTSVATTPSQLHEILSKSWFMAQHTPLDQWVWFQLIHLTPGPEIF